MKLKIQTINQVVIIVSGISAILDAIVAILHGTPWWAWPLTAVCTFLITYYLSKFFLHQYVIYRIKPLYQLLLSKDIITSRLTEDLRKKVSNDLVDDIQENLNHLVAFSGTELERLDKEKKLRSEFLVAVFHEIKTPVSIIQGYTQTILENGLENQEMVHKYLERININVERLTNIVKDMETITCYDSEIEVVAKEKFNIVELVNEVVCAYQNIAEVQEIRVNINPPVFDTDKLPLVYADRKRIRQVLINILVNAIKYNDTEGEVTISFVDMFDKILIETTDTGDGIPSEDIPHIFEDFYRVEKGRTRERGGSGLGLSIVKRIIDAHDENITVRSEVGIGTTFSFTLTKG